MVKNTKSTARVSGAKKSSVKKVVSATNKKSAMKIVSTKKVGSKNINSAKQAEPKNNFKRNRLIVIAILVISFLGIPSLLYGRSAYEKHQDKQKFLQLAEDLEKLKTDIEKQYGVSVVAESYCVDNYGGFNNLGIYCNYNLSFSKSINIEKLLSHAESFVSKNGAYYYGDSMSCAARSGDFGNTGTFLCSGKAANYYFSKK